MNRGKVVVLLFTVLLLNLSVTACAGFTSQGPQEQKRPAENQNSVQEDAQKTALETPERSMEETAKAEQTER